MEANLRGRVGTGTEEDESSTGRVWAAGFHHFMTSSCLGCVLELMYRLFPYFSIFFSGRGKPRIRGSACV